MKFYFIFFLGNILYILLNKMYSLTKLVFRVLSVIPYSKTVWCGFLEIKTKISTAVQLAFNTFGISVFFNRKHHKRRNVIHWLDFSRLKLLSHATHADWNNLDREWKCETSVNFIANVLYFGKIYPENQVVKLRNSICDILGLTRSIL